MQRASIAGNPLVHCLLVTSVDDVPLGFLTYWRFPGFTYVEHFAISPDFRGRGFGAEAIAAFVEMQHRPVVLEAELAGSNPMAGRRVAFYQRQGFEVLPQPYLQPSYPTRGAEPLPMHILVANPQDDSLPLFQTIRDTLYQNVYA